MRYWLFGETPNDTCTARTQTIGRELLQDDPIHWGDSGFEDFVEEELSGLAERAQARGICIDCLSDRLIFEVVAGLVRSGVSEDEIMSVVQDALDDAEEDQPDYDSAPPRIH